MNKKTKERQPSIPIVGVGGIAILVGIITMTYQIYDWGIGLMLLGGLSIYVAFNGIGSTLAIPFRAIGLLLSLYPRAVSTAVFGTSVVVLLTLWLAKVPYASFGWFVWVTLVISGIYSAVAWLKYSQGASREVVPDRTEYEIKVDEKLPELLINYYSPLSEFPLPNLSARSDLDPETAKALALDEREYMRLQNASMYISSAWNGEEDESLIKLVLEVKPGTTVDDVLGKFAVIEAGIPAYNVEVDPEPFNEPENNEVPIRFYMTRQSTSLEKLTVKVDSAKFFEENPMESQNEVPLGVTPNGSSFFLPVHHTLCTARTGGGKGSVLQTYLYQLMPFIANGTAKAWFVDPKNTEVDRYKGTSALHRYATEEADIVSLIFDFYDHMNAKRALDGLSSSHEPTVEDPSNFLFLDEGADVLDDPSIIKVKNEQGLTPKDALKSVSRKGRSLGFYIVMFTQEITADPMGTLPKNMPVKMVGYVESAYETAKALGAKEADLDSYKELIFPLPESTKANGMKYSGIFNVKMDGERVAIRVPFVSKEMTAARLAEFGLDAAPTDHPRTYNTVVRTASSKADMLRQKQELQAEREATFVPVSVAELEDAFSNFDED